MKKDTVLTLVLTALIALCVMYSSQSKTGAAEGFNMCETIIIPSLLPILILTNIIIRSRCSNVIDNIFGKIFSKLFNLPKCCSSAVILGMISGFPSGAILTHSLYKTGCIDEKTAQRVIGFNFCGGMAFIITAVGTISYSSTKTGIILYLINVITALTVGIISGRFYDKPTDTQTSKDTKLNFTDALVCAVETSCNSIINMCGFIILFSALCALIKLPEWIYPLIEITKGVCQNKISSLPYCAFFLSFGGICIHLQLIGILRDVNMKYYKYFIYRLASALLSFGIAYVYTLIFPSSATVFSNVATTIPKPYQVNTALSIVMVVGCAVLIFDIENKKALGNKARL